MQFASRIVQCSINCIFGSKLNPLKSLKYQKESYQINDYVFNTTKFNKKNRVINFILAKIGLLGNAETAKLGNETKYMIYSNQNNSFVHTPIDQVNT